MFNTIGLITKSGDATSEQIVGSLSEHLNDFGLDIVHDAKKIKETADLVIVIGGDGTMLSTARLFVDASIPLLGINLGRLGFLVDASLENMKQIIAEILDGEYIEEQRSLLSCQIKQANELIANQLAFNDAVLHREHTGRILEFDIYVDDSFVTSQRADGLIVCTPTGSTAYALSSGGPLVHPTVRAISLVPVCPHTLSNRPLVLNADCEIRIQINDATADASVNFDGQSSFPFTIDQQLVVNEHNNFIRLIHPKNYNYLNIVRSKLGWGTKAY